MAMEYTEMVSVADSVVRSRTEIGVSRPCLGAEELAAVGEVFASHWLGYGPRTERFEAEFAEHVGVSAERLIFLNSATAGLFLAVELLDVGPGDDVVLPSVSFVAAANAVVAVGARPVFCDVDPYTLNPSVEDVRRVLTPRTRVVLVLHYGGFPVAEIAGIAGLCERRGIALVEDAACAVTSSVDGRMCGTFGDIAMWSLDSRKIITTGDGGMLYVRDAVRASRARRLAYHGLADRSAFTSAGKVPHRWWEFGIEEAGRRVIGNDVTAAIGSVQLRRLPGFVARHRGVAEAYDRLLAGVGGVRLMPRLPVGHCSSYSFYWVQLDPAVRDRVAEVLLSRGVYTTFRYAPLHRIPLYRWDVELPGTDHAAASTLNLPLHQGLDDADVHTVAAELRRAVAETSHSTTS